MGFSAKNINFTFPKFDYLNFMFEYWICVRWYKEVKHSSLYEELVYRPYKNSILWTFWGNPDGRGNPDCFLPSSIVRITPSSLYIELDQLKSSARQNIELEQKIGFSKF